MIKAMTGDRRERLGRNEMTAAGEMMRLPTGRLDREDVV